MSVYPSCPYISLVSGAQVLGGAAQEELRNISLVVTAGRADYSRMPEQDLFENPVDRPYPCPYPSLSLSLPLPRARRAGQRC